VPLIRSPPRAACDFGKYFVCGSSLAVQATVVPKVNRGGLVQQEGDSNEPVLHDIV